MRKSRQEKYFDVEAGQEKIRFEWYCDGCRATIQPLLRIHVGDRPERACDEVPLFHPVGLRNLLEIHLGVDNNYRSLYQRDVGLLRQNKNIYWNMVFYFQVTELPVAFIKPYEEKVFMANALQQEMSKLRLSQLVRRYGYEHIEVAGPEPGLRKMHTQDLSGSGPKKLISPSHAAKANNHARVAAFPSPRGLGARTPRGHKSSPIAMLPNHLVQTNSGVVINQRENSN